MTRIPSADAMGKAYRPKVLSEEQDDVFKVPPLPDQKGKGKAPDIAKELEKANKAVCHASLSSFLPTHPVLATSQVVKRAASDCLAKYGIHKTNADFKEIWGFVYRGTEFALVRLSPLFID